MALGMMKALLSLAGPPMPPFQGTGRSHKALCQVGLNCSTVLPVLHLSCVIVMPVYKVNHGVPAGKLS